MWDTLSLHLGIGGAGRKRTKFQICLFSMLLKVKIGSNFLYSHSLQDYENHMWLVCVHTHTHSLANPFSKAMITLDKLSMISGLEINQSLWTKREALIQEKLLKFWPKQCSPGWDKQWNDKITRQIFDRKI